MKISRENKRKILKGLLIVGFLYFVLLLVALIILPHIAQRSPANDAQSDITTLVAGIKSLAREKSGSNDRGEYAWLNEKEVIKENINPARMLRNGSLYSEWGAVRILPGTDNKNPSSTNDFFVIRYEDVPGEVCVKLLHGMLANFHAVYVSDKPSPSNDPLQSVISVSEIPQKCSSARSVHIDFVSK